MTYLNPGLPAPIPARDGLDTPYWEGTQRHELWVQQCESCTTFQWGPEWMCHDCRSFDVGWTQVDARGEIYSWERPHHPVHPALAEQGPYLVVLVTLPHAGGIRMVGNLLGEPLQHVEIGASVRAAFEDHPSNGETNSEPAYTLVQWELA